MAIAQPAPQAESSAQPARRPPVPWLWWIGASVIGAVVGALAAWQIRSLATSANLAGGGQDALRYVATILSSLVAAAAQWWVLRRYRLDAYWWVPASVVSSLIATSILVPGLVGLLAPGNAGAAGSQVRFIGAVALGASGLVVGIAQAAALRMSIANTASLWVAATMFGGALAGAITTALAPQLLGLSTLLAITIVAGAASLLTAVIQAPVFVRLLR